VDLKISADRQIAKPEDKSLLVGLLFIDHRMPEAEHRQLTVMFFDLIGSMALFQQQRSRRGKKGNPPVYS
jgi:hypothetical protein